MTEPLVRGPWTGPPIRQDPPLLTPQRWWKRLPSGHLVVLCHGARTRNERYQTAPIDEWHPLPGEGTRTNVIPDRSPNPDRITVALDQWGLYGPEVDEALGVADALDTVVDSWENAATVPTEEPSNQ